MLLCPKCKDPEMRFEVEMSTRAVYIMECFDNGDYEKEEREFKYLTWHQVMCLSCLEVVDEDEARDLFDDRQNREPGPEDDHDWFMSYWHPDGGTGEGGHHNSEHGCHELCPACKESSTT